MSYAPPSLGPAGLTIAQYTDILNLFTSSFQAIYGPGIYLGTDSPDYQICSMFALNASDALQALQNFYLNSGPGFATGAALDIVVAFNGLIRKAASYSTCTVTITGTVGTVITGGKVRDSVPGQGYLWDLPSSVTIPSGGSINVTVTCEVIGASTALAGQIAQIAIGTAGWISVTNPAAANVGQAAETDSQLRARQAISTEMPSSTLLDGTFADVGQVEGVTRWLVLENPTGGSVTTWPIASGSPNWYGSNGHSITAIVEGGANNLVANAIYYNRGIGCNTQGSGTSPNAPTVVNVFDPVSGQTFAVSIYRPVYQDIYVTANLNQLTSAPVPTATIQTNVINYLNGLALGATVSWASIMAVVMSSAGNLENPIFDVTTLYIGTSATPSGVVDIVPTTPWQTARPAVAGSGAGIIINP